VAGLVGEGGQYSLPDGEWFCTQCFTAAATSPVHPPASFTAVTPTAAAATGGGGKSGRSKGKRGSGNGGGTGADAGNGGSDAYDSDASDGFAKAPNRDASSVLATIKSEYHNMRKERNRILAQWQQEKKIIEKYETSRRIEQQRRDKELFAARDEIATLKNAVATAEAQATRMQALFEFMLKDVQNQGGGGGGGEGGGGGQALQQRQLALGEDGAPQWASMTLESLLNMPIENITAGRTEQHASFSSHPGAPRGNKMGGGEYPHVGIGGATSVVSSVTSIPKPWVAKGGTAVRTGGSLPGAGTGGGGGGGGVADVRKANSADAAEEDAATGSRSPLSPGKSAKTSSTSVGTSFSSSSSAGGLAVQRSNSLTALTAPTTIAYPGGSAGAAATAAAAGASDTEASSSPGSRSPAKYLQQQLQLQQQHHHQQQANSLAINTSSTGGNGSNSNNNSSSTGPSSVSKTGSKFVNPLQNRLKDLLKSVEAEADAFAEIRQKFKSREDERSQLRNSADNK
jgi:hypothetical protein